MSRRRTWTWVTRDSDDNEVCLWFKARPKPKRDSTGCWWTRNNEWDSYCYKEFRRVTGLRIRPGQLLKVEFSAKVLEEVKGE